MTKNNTLDRVVYIIFNILLCGLPWLLRIIISEGVRQSIKNSDELKLDNINNK